MIKSNISFAFWCTILPRIVTYDELRCCCHDVMYIFTLLCTINRRYICQSHLAQAQNPCYTDIYYIRAISPIKCRGPPLAINRPVATALIPAGRCTSPRDCGFSNRQSCSDRMTTLGKCLFFRRCFVLDNNLFLFVGCV